jgi:hypothetical protein
VQISLLAVPALESVTLAVEVSINRQDWVAAPGVGFLAAPTLQADFITTTALYNGYTLTPYRWFRVRNTAATTATGRMRISMSVSKTLPTDRAAELTEGEILGTPDIEEQQAVWAAVDGFDAAAVQISPLGGTFTGSLTLAPQITLDGEQWATPYLVIDRTIITTPAITFSGSSVIEATFNVQGAQRFRVLTDGAAPTGSMLISINMYRTPYGPAAVAGAKGA